MIQGREGDFLYHTSCERCGSSDAKAVYSSGTAFCFSCESYFSDVEGGGTRVKINKDITTRFLGYKALHTRGITEETCRKYGYCYVEDKGEVKQCAPYYKNGELVAQHLRSADKRFSWVGDTRDLELFGQSKWKSGGKRLVITEGEIDCLTIAQVFNLRWQVVSVPNGAASAKKYIKQNIEFVESFEEIVLSFDMDEQGRKATEEVAQLLTPGKVKIADWSPYKDPNEMLQAGKGAEIAQRIFNAKLYRPDGIIAGSDITLEDLLEDENYNSYELPYPELNDMLKGLRKGEITTITAGTGIGKSTLAREIAYHLAVKHGLKIGVVALEESIKKSALGYMAIRLNVPMGDLFLDKSIVPIEDFEDAYMELIASDRFYFYDHFGSLESDNLLHKLKYLASGLDVDFIVLDHISIVVSGIADGDERRIIDNLMTDLRSLVENTGVGMLLISHLSVPQGGAKAHEEGGRVTLNQLRGSGSIKQISDNIIGVERNQQGKDPNVSLIRLLKNRLIGVTGKAGYVRYHRDTGRLLPSEPPVEEEEQEDDEMMMWIGEEGESDF